MRNSGALDRRSARIVVLAAVTLALGVAAAAWWSVARTDPAPTDAPDPPPSAVIAPEARVGVTEAVSSLAILRDWDRARAAAWSEGDAAALGRLYLPGAAARADRAMLRRWAERGLRVDAMQMQVLAVELRRRTARKLVLIVTDRLVGARAVWAGARGVRPLALPRDRASTRKLVFRNVSGRWLLASARELP